MGKILNWYKQTKSFLSKEVRVFNASSSASMQNMPFIPNWFNTVRLGTPRNIDIIELRQYAKSPWVQMVINTISKQVMTTEWDIVEKEAKDVKETINEEQKPHPDIQKAKDFLKQPNRNGDTFWDVWIPFLRDVLELDAGVIWKGKNASGELVELYPYDGGRFVININQHGIIGIDEEGNDSPGYYQYSFRQIDAAPVPFARDEIVYGKMNTNTELMPYGWSPLQSIQQEVEVMIQSTRYNKEFFKNNAIPDGIISADMNTDQLNQFKAAWDLNMRGQAHKLAFLNSDASFTNLSQTNKDMEWLEGQKWYFHVVFGAYGLSPMEAGFYEDGNRATGESQERVTVKNAIKPYLDLIEAKINREILPEYLGHDKLEFKWFPHDDAAEKIQHEQMMAKLNANVLTINEVRAEEGLEPVEWGDVPMAMMMQDRMLEANGQETEDGEEDDDNDNNPKDKKDDKEDSKDKDRDKKKEEAEEKKDKEIKKELDAGEEVVIEAKDYADFLRIRFQKWQTDVFKFLDDTLKEEFIEKDYMEKTFGEFIRSLFNAINTKGFRKGIGAIITATFKEGMQEAEKELNVDIGFDSDFTAKVKVVEEQQVEGYFTADGKWDGIKGISEEAQKDILNIVHKGLADREGLKVVKENIKTKMDQLVGTESTDGRAMRIARTESNRMINESKLLSYQKSGLKGKKRWNAFHDGRTSDVCKALNNETKELNELFRHKDGAWQTPPSHPNCRSVVEFVLDIE